MERQGQMMYQQLNHGASGNQHEALRVSWQPSGAWTHIALQPACPAPILAPQLSCSLGKVIPFPCISVSSHLKWE